MNPKEKLLLLLPPPEALLPHTLLIDESSCILSGGTIVPSSGLGNLIFLQCLVLDQNFLYSGTVPSELGKLMALRIL
jgi:hypothetical protein